MFMTFYIACPSFPFQAPPSVLGYLLSAGLRKKGDCQEGNKAVTKNNKEKAHAPKRRGAELASHSPRTV